MQERSASRASFSFREALREAGHLSLAPQGVNLRGAERKRYLEMKRKVENEIAAGTRTPGEGTYR